MFDTGLAQLVGVGIQTIIFIAAGYGMVIRTDASVNSLKEEVRDVQKEIKAMADVVTKIAVQSVRIDGITDRINMLDSRITDVNRRLNKVDHN